MSLKFKYILFVGILHGIVLGLIFLLLKENKILFIISEFLILISLYLSYLLYKDFIKPIELMHSGTDAILDADFSVKYLKTGSKEIDKLVSIYNSMIDQLRTEKTLMSEQSYFIQNLIEVTPIGIVILDFDGLISNINPSAQKMLQIKGDWKSKKLSDYQSEFMTMVEKIPVGIPQLISLNGLDKYKCQHSEVIHQGFKRKFILLDDLTSEIIQSEKEAYGRIIRMMAHEVNNSMGAINSILDSVVEFGFHEAEQSDLKESLIIAKNRNVGLSSFMNNFASILRIPPVQKKKIDLSKLLKKSGMLFVPSAEKQNIKIYFDLPVEENMIEGDEILLEQAISNIIKNAIESIGQNGKVKISSQHESHIITISDNGLGIPEEEKHKIFTPFYSTKVNGQGVGLMLIREILVKHHAKFSLSTDAESGWTSFEVRFN